MELDLLSSVDLVGCYIIQLWSAAFAIDDFIFFIRLACNFITITVLNDEIEAGVVFRPRFKESETFVTRYDIGGGWKSELMRVLVGLELIVTRLRESSIDFGIASFEVNLVQC